MISCMISFVTVCHVYPQGAIVCCLLLVSLLEGSIRRCVLKGCQVKQHACLPLFAVVCRCLSLFAEYYCVVGCSSTGNQGEWKIMREQAQATIATNGSDGFFCVTFVLCTVVKLDCSTLSL